MEFDKIETDEGNDAINNAVLDEKDQSEKAGGFFVVDLKQIDKMVELGAMAEDVMAYMVLAKGVNRRGDMRVSTHGAQSIFKRTGMSYTTKAEAALVWLHENNFIHKPASETVLGKGVSKARTVKWVLTANMDSLDVALANALVEGIGRGKNNPPLMRIYNETKLGKHCIIADSILDSVMVLVHLYRHHTFADCGGINPRDCLYRNWESAENVAGEKVTDIEGTNAALYEITGESNTVFYSSANEALFYIEDETERYARFWEAFRNLEALGLLYEVTQIWDSNPNGKEGRKAKPLYTLYIHDRHARESEPYLQKAIHTFAFKTGAMDRSREFWHEAEAGDIKSGWAMGKKQFRYIATKKKGGYPIGIYRLRFRPHTQDTGMGMAAENKRVNEWAYTLKSLASNAF